MQLGVTHTDRCVHMAKEKMGSCTAEWTGGKQWQWSTLAHASTALTLNDNAHCAAPDLNPNSYSNHQMTMSSEVSKFTLVLTRTDIQGHTVTSSSSIQTQTELDTKEKNTQCLWVLTNEAIVQSSKHILSEKRLESVHWWCQAGCPFFFPLFLNAVCVWGATHAGDTQTQLY